MPRFGELSRSLAGVLLVLLVASVSARGYCPMGSGTATSADAAEDSTEHSCCRSGLTSAPPACCHSGPDGGVAAAEAKVRPVGPSPGTLQTWFVASQALAPARDVPASPSREHGPPSTVLRI